MVKEECFIYNVRNMQTLYHSVNKYYK